MTSLRPRSDPIRTLARALAAALTLVALPAAAQDGGDFTLEDVFGAGVRNHAEGALAVLGISAVPSETASALFLDTGTNPDRSREFQAAQLGGGFRWSEDFPLYLEGYIGYSRYDPKLIFDDGTERIRAPLRWTSVAATGGIGWEFDLGEDWVLRPVLNVSLGRVQTDASLLAQYVSNEIGVEASFLRGGGLTAGGIGGSVALAYNRRWTNDYEADLILRHTHIRLFPIAGDKDITASADAITSALWSRLRIPTPYRAFDRPVRTVAEFSASYMPGDQGEILRTDWLAQVGFGGEIDLEATPIPWVTTTRLMLRYTRGEVLEGYSIGLAASF